MDAAGFSTRFRRDDERRILAIEHSTPSTTALRPKTGHLRDFSIDQTTIAVARCLDGVPNRQHVNDGDQHQMPRHVEYRSNARQQHQQRRDIKDQLLNAGRPAEHQGDVVQPLCQRETFHGERVVIEDRTEVAFTPSETLHCERTQVGGSETANKPFVDVQRLPTA